MSRRSTLSLTQPPRVTVEISVYHFFRILQYPLLVPYKPEPTPAEFAEELGFEYPPVADIEELMALDARFALTVFAARTFDDMQSDWVHWHTQPWSKPNRYMGTNHVARTFGLPNRLINDIVAGRQWIPFDLLVLLLRHPESRRDLTGVLMANDLLYKTEPPKNKWFHESFPEGIPSVTLFYEEVQKMPVRQQFDELTRLGESIRDLIRLAADMESSIVSHRDDDGRAKYSAGTARWLEVDRHLNAPVGDEPSSPVHGKTFRAKVRAVIDDEPFRAADIHDRLHAARIHYTPSDKVNKTLWALVDRGELQMKDGIYYRPRQGLANGPQD